MRRSETISPKVKVMIPRIKMIKVSAKMIAAYSSANVFLSKSSGFISPC